MTTEKKLKYNEPWILQRADPYVYRHVDGSVKEGPDQILRKVFLLGHLSFCKGNSSFSGLKL